jgi:hypothetical protein
MAIERIMNYFIEEGIRCEIKDSVAVFMITDIADNKDWRVVGQATYARYHTGDFFINIHITVARKAKRELYDKICVKFAELNSMSVFGNLYMDGTDNIVYMYNIPLVRDDDYLTEQTFRMVFGEMRNFIEAYYAYILVVINEPDKLELSRYIELMTMDENEDEEE